MNRPILNGVLVLLLIALGLVAWLSTQKDSSFFKPIQSYELLSEFENVKPAEIDAIMAKYLGLSFWDVELDLIQSELARLDWVDKALVKRSWPDRLYVSIEEQKPVARWGDSGLVNQQGIVFYPQDGSQFNNLVVLDGTLSESADILLALVKFQKKLHEIGFTVMSLKRQVDGVWRIALHNDSELVVESEGGEEKVSVFVRAYSKLPKALRKSAQIYDLRYSNGFIVGNSVSSELAE